MQAIILAAGMGKRLKDLTKNQTKCMIKVNGVTLIERMLHQLDRQYLSRIVVVVGYEGGKLIDYIRSLEIQTPVVFVNNPIYNKTNNIYSLYLAKEYMREEDTLLLESDLIFDDGILDVIIKDPRDSLALVDKYQSWMDGTCIKIDEKDDRILAFVPGKKFRYEECDSYYKTVNIYKFGRHFSQTYYIPFLEAYSTALGRNEYYEQVLRVITVLDDPEIFAKRLTGEHWYEIDDIQDLDIAESIFTPDEDQKVFLLQGRYGGYWRYPNLVDFCYLSNPYYPPQRMKDEIKASFNELIMQYPSGMRVIALLAAKNYGVLPENILVGNGASELIKSFLEQMADGLTGVIRPTFGEYISRCKEEQMIFFIPDDRDFSYTADDVMTYFENREIRTLVIMNPNNLMGNYIPKEEMLRLLGWAAERQIRMVVDESFVDFADERDGTLIDQRLLDANPHLYVIKSVSQSHGVPGLRLGVLASGDRPGIAKMKQDVTIWNINSCAEFFLQIEEKYRKDYMESLEQLRQERRRFEKGLSQIEHIRVIPSQANYVIVEVSSDKPLKELVKCLLVKYGLLIREWPTNENGGQYLRFAIRGEADNDKLLSALRNEISCITCKGELLQ